MALAVTAADLVGAMRGAVTLATGYAKDRRQYGQAIGSFQAVQHLLATSPAATEACGAPPCTPAGPSMRWRPTTPWPRRRRQGGARAARSVCETAIQVHGGIGNTWECLAHVHLRRALLSSDVLSVRASPGARPPRNRRLT